MKSQNRQKIIGDFHKESGYKMYCFIITLKKREMGIIENIKKLFMGTGYLLASAISVGSTGDFKIHMVHLIF